MLVEEFTEINEEVKDGVGEITNMISGDARRQLEGIGMEFAAGIPTVITGKNHGITSLYNGLTSCLVIPFTCDGLDFYVEAIFSAK
jgi:chemotaxis protein CheX